MMVSDRLDKRDDDRRMAHVRALRTALKRAVKRLDRRVDAIRGDLARIQNAEAAAAHARLFVSRAAHAQRGATNLDAVDWSSGEPQRVELALDPARAAKEQIEAIFRRARRLLKGAQMAQERLAASERSRAALAALAETLEAAVEGGVDLAALELQARAIEPRLLPPETTAVATQRSRSRTPQRTQRPQPRPPPYRTFVGETGARILVGRGAARNDALTFDVARPQDLWLHAKGRAGAHVVVPLDKNRSCPPDVLVEAAHLAAHFSAAREDPLVEVQYTPRRYVRKPRGSAPGFVLLGREKVMLLRRNTGLLRRLLQRET
jgi:predicted ribosome quality control (RQC) complex YloA/Tae2 family protein